MAELNQHTLSVIQIIVRQRKQTLTKPHKAFIAIPANRSTPREMPPAPRAHSPSYPPAMEPLLVKDTRDVWLCVSPPREAAPLNSPALALLWPCSSSSTFLQEGLHSVQTTEDKISSRQACQQQLLPTKESLSGENALSKPAMLQEQWLLT